MALPKRRKSRARVRTRRQHWRAAPVTGTVCAHCDAAILPHRACDKCGYYNGRLIVAPPVRNEAGAGEE